MIQYEWDDPEHDIVSIRGGVFPDQVLYITGREIIELAAKIQADYDRADAAEAINELERSA